MKKFVTVALVVIQDNRLLLLRSKNKQAFYMPGGKLEHSESDELALIREINEELSVILLRDSVKHVCTVEAQAYGENIDTLVEIRCYSGTYEGSPAVGSEIAEMKYFTFDQYQQTETAPAVIKIFECLKEMKLLR